MTAAQVTTAGLNLYRDSVRAADTPTIAYVAIGTGNSTPTASQTKLDAEVFRKSVSNYSAGSDGVVVVNAVLGAGDAVGVVIAEVAWYGGDDASATANSGVMIARGLYSHTKASESLQLPLTLTFS